MAFYTKSFVFAALGENAAGIPFSKGLPQALVSSTFRSPVAAMVVGLLLGRTQNTASHSGFSIAIPPTTTGGGASASGGTGTSGASGTPKITKLTLNDSGDLKIDGENFGRRKSAVTLTFSWPAGSPHMSTEKMSLARHKDIDLTDEEIVVPMSFLPEAAAHSKIVVVVTVNDVESNPRDIDL